MSDVLVEYITLKRRSRLRRIVRVPKFYRSIYRISRDHRVALRVTWLMLRL